MKRIDKTKVVEELLSDNFRSFLYDILEKKTDNLLADNPEDYGAKWNSNPYDVEPQLASGSGCYEYPEWGEDAAWDDAKEDFMDSWTDIKDILPDYMVETKDLLEDYNNYDFDWMTGILTYILNTDLKERH